MIADVKYTDKELFLLIADGDEHAFEEIFYRYLPKLQLVIQKIVKEETVVNDIIQEIFLSLWIDRSRLPEIESPEHWIFRLMYNRSLNWVKRHSNRTISSNELSEEMLSMAQSNITEESVLFSEASRIVKDAIRQLPSQTQKIYLLSREKGLKIQEIADMLNLSPQTVKNTLNRAANSIRQHLVSSGIEIPVVILAFTFL